MRRTDRFRILIAIFVVLCVCGTFDARAETVVGVVFADANHNGRLDAGEKGLPGVRVSNGREIVVTDENGRYELPIDGDANIFVIKPRHFRTAISDDGLPQFYYLHRPDGSPKMRYPGIDPTGALPASVDFPLYPQHEPDRFSVLVFGDPQPRNSREIHYILRDTVDELAGSETAAQAAFGISLGDIVYDDLALFEELNTVISAIGVPWHNVPGNHDQNQDAPDNFYAAESFQRVYGPRYYAFDYGPVHFIVLDNIYWVQDDDGSRSYRAGLGTEQMTFLGNTLEQVPKDQPIVLLMHIAIARSTGWGEGEQQALFELLRGHSYILSFGAHSHRRHMHHLLDESDGWHGARPLHSVTHGTVSGSWWRGASDEYGIPHAMMADGMPTGYSILTFDGRHYQLRFKASRRCAEFQMHIYTPDTIEAGGRVLANIFNAMPEANVGMKVGEKGRWEPMQKVFEHDPYFQEMVQREEIHSARIRSTRCPHLWAGNLPENLPPGAHVVYVRGQNPDGQVFEGRHVVVLRP